MKIEVTEEDIKSGKAKDCDFCPIARAASRVYGRLIEVAAAYAYAGVKSVFLPGIATRFITDFDSGRPVAPFTFDLPPLSEWK